MAILCIGDVRAARLCAVALLLFCTSHGLMWPAGAQTISDGAKAYREGNDSSALKIFKQHAERGDAGAQSSLAGLYWIGRGVQQDDAEAFKWYDRSARQGYATAQYLLGRL